MTQKISSVNIEASTLSSFTGPLISTVSIANSSYVIVDDTAVSNAGGYAVITGNNFVSGAQVLFGSTSATSVTYVNSSTLRVQVPALTAGSYVMYVQNPDGSTAIRLNGITSSPIPVWSTASTLSDQDLGVSFSINLSASSDSSVIYALSAGSSLPSGTTLASNGLFSGTVTGIESETTYNFSVDAIDAENQETVRSFSITITAGDANYKDTVLHLSGETSNNTWITDASTNKFALTLNGDVRPTAFSPYETVWSNFFDGTGDDLTVPANSAFAYGTGDFTIEMWVFISANPAIDYAYIYGQGPLNSTAMSLYIQSGKFNVWSGSAVISSATSYSLNRWYHVVISRSGTSLKLFLDGVQDGSATNTSNVASGSTYGVSIGRWAEIGDNRYFNGYVSNLRVVKGTAVYTSAFTPPTSPLTAITNTSLLTCQSNRLIDNSTNNFTITKNGDVSVSNFGPFVETDLITGSAYFDGTGDWLTFPNSSSFAFGTGSFTIEFWINAPLNNDKFLLGGRTAIGTMHITTGGSGSTAGVLRYVGSSTIVSTNVITDNSWHHCAIVRNGSSSVTLYVDGVSVGTGTDTTNYTTTSGDWKIGSNDSFAGSNILTGYISNLRILKGTALYTSAFTPPSSLLTAITNTSLLTLQSRIGENNNRFVDTSGVNNLITRSGNATQGTYSPFSQNGWSNYFDGTGDSLSAVNNAAFNPETQDFVIEAWVYITGLTAANQGINGKGTAGTDGYSFFITNALTLSFIWNGTGGTTITGGTLSLNRWHHVAAVRNDNVIRLYLDGVGAASSTSCTTNITSTATKFIGQARGANPMLGYMSNYRMTKGSRPVGYDATTSTLTVPNSTLTAITNTSILTCQSNRFVDNSTNNFTITRNGDVSVQAFSPIKPSNEWSANTVGGSMYFDGSDYLLVPDNVNLRMESGNFTIEYFIYYNSIAGYITTFSKGYTAAGAILFQTGNGDGRTIIYLSGVAAITESSAATVGQWYHYALVRNGTTVTLYRNGVSVGSTTSSVNFNITDQMGIGATGTAPGGGAVGQFAFTGYMSNVRVIKGTALYTTTFTPPTAPPTPIPGTTLLLNGTNGGIIDYTSRNNLETVGNSQVRNSVSKYGNGSMYFDGTGDFIQTFTPNQSLAFRTGDFTVECWVNFNTGGQHGIYQISSNPGGFNASNGNSIAIQRSATGQWEIYAKNSNPQVTATINQNQWYHLAITRSGTTTRFYVDGTLLITVSADTTDYTGTHIGLGAIYSTVVPLNGYIDDFRVTKGVARYTANFTAPTSAFKTR